MYNHIIICIYIYIYTSSVYSQSIYYVCFFDYIYMYVLQVVSVISWWGRSKYMIILYSTMTWIVLLDL